MIKLSITATTRPRWENYGENPRHKKCLGFEPRDGLKGLAAITQLLTRASPDFNIPTIDLKAALHPGSIARILSLPGEIEGSTENKEGPKSGNERVVYHTEFRSPE